MATRQPGARETIPVLKGVEIERKGRIVVQRLEERDQGRLMPIRNKNAELETRRVGETKGGRMGNPEMTSRVGRWMGEG